MAVIHRFNGAGNAYKWEHVKEQEYDAEGIEGVMKHIIVGPEDGATHFVIRYFELQPDSSSQLERHVHDHGVVILQGTARVQVEQEFVTLNPLDAVYVAGNDLHQFTNIGDQPLGFICVIKAGID